MNFFDLFLFVVKYIPFWCVPLGLSGAHFAYIYWLKDYKDIAYGCGAITLFCLTLVVIYLAMGGPDGVTQFFAHNFR